jgi:hypothetical protein
MKILFTILSIDSGNVMYLQSAKRLVNEILEQTKHDVLVSTNNLNFFEDISSERFISRNNIDSSCILKYGSEFNYNLKYNAFENISSAYDVIIYLDCDIKLDGWNQNSDNHIDTVFQKYDFGATRLNCSMISSVNEYRETGRTLFSHKINSYKILEKYGDDDDIMFSLLPSEHFLILKNDVNKIKKFYERWKELNYHLQSINGEGGSWGDGFEIGISARYAGFHATIEINQGEWDGILGFKFNGNKFMDQQMKKILLTEGSTLTELANKFGSDKGTEHFERHSYTEEYQKYILPYKNSDVKMLEIGVNDERFPAASIKIWTSFFPNVNFIGFDINESSKMYEKDNVKIFIGDQGNENDLIELVKMHGDNYDIIIDDGSHQHPHHILTFLTLEPHLKVGGIYIIEDLHAFDGHLTIEWFNKNNKKYDLLCSDKLLIYKKNG